MLRMAKQKEKEVRTLMTLWGHHSDPGLPTSGLIWHDRQDIFVSKSLLFGCFITSSQTQFLPGEVGGWCVFLCIRRNNTEQEDGGGVGVLHCSKVFSEYKTLSITAVGNPSGQP